MRVLILGGTTQANSLAERMSEDPRFDALLSLAGRTKAPVLPRIPSRTGGFGGIGGLTNFLRDESIDMLIDATHPFAEQMSTHALGAAHVTKIPMAVFTRAAWAPTPGDRWREFEDAKAAAGGIGPTPRRVFLTVGRLQLAAFSTAPQHHYLIRTIDAPDPMPALPHHRLLLARGPFRFDDELQLMRDARIEVLVSKNSGGNATSAKLHAARTLGVDVLLISRPQNGPARIFETLDGVFDFIVQHLHANDP